jgi:two-component system, chemotaxis family, chemotaxis protein CheY
MRVLVIDDSSTLRMVLKRILRELAIAEVAEAESGSEALAMWATDTAFDVILIDRNMPGETGAEVVRRLRLTPAGQAPKILMVSSDATVDRIKEAMTAGCDGFLPKPFSASQLRQQLVRLQTLT